MTKLQWLLIAVVASCPVACTQPGEATEAASSLPSDRVASPQTHSSVEISAISTQQAVSLLGQPLFAPELPDAIRVQLEEDLYNAQIEYDRDLHNEEAIIWLGRRQAYLGLYRESVDTFSNGLAIMPESTKLLRHRGHRYITLRRFDDAIADLSLAAALIENMPDEVEPDGQPNASGIPTSTLHTNIHYHLGLAHYLKGDWRAAARAYHKCVEASANDDMRIAAMYWLYLSLVRAGDPSGAGMVLERVSANMNVIENDAYWKLLRVFKGELDQGALETGDGVSGDRTIDLATLGYGLGVREVIQGHSTTAIKRFSDIIANTNWAAFGHIASEAEMLRLQSP